MSPSPAPSVGVSPSAGARPTPTVDVPLLPASDLIYRIPARLRPLCFPVDLGDVGFETIACIEGTTRIIYVRHVTVEAMDRQFNDLIAGFSLAPVVGGCKAGIPSQDVWHYSRTPDRVEGRMACLIAPPDIPITVVTQPGERLLSAVQSDPGVGLAGHYQNWSNAAPNPPIANGASDPAAGGP